MKGGVLIVINNYDQQLLIVVELDDPHILCTLLDCGMPLKSATTNDCVLHSAAEMGSIEFQKIILERKNDLKLDFNLMNDAHDVSALQRVCAYGNYFIVKMLLVAEADPDLPSRDGITPLSYSMEVMGEWNCCCVEFCYKGGFV